MRSSRGEKRQNHYFAAVLAERNLLTVVQSNDEIGRRPWNGTLRLES